MNPSNNLFVFLVTIIVGLCLAHESGESRETSFEKINASELIQLLNGQEENEATLVDIRTHFMRQFRGFLPDSLIVDSIDDLVNSPNFRPFETVVVVNHGKPVEETDVRLGDKEYVFDEGIISWLEAGGSIEYPQFINFSALNRTLEENLMPVIDVRNRSELNEYGQIPGTFCVPLHEIKYGAFDADVVSNEAFKERYGLDRPGKQTPFIITCRSGRRVLVAQEILEGLGYSKLRIYRGSFNDWKKQGGEILPGNYDLDYEIWQ